MKKLKFWLGLCALVLLLTTWQTQAFAKKGGSSKSSSTSTERPKQHGAQGTGNFKGKRDAHQKPSPQNEKKKKTDKWLRLKK